MPPNQAPDELLGKTVKHVNGESILLIGQYINRGAFGRLYKGKTLKKISGFEPNTEVAIKMEEQNVDRPQVPLEFKFYRLIGDFRAIPKIVYFGPFERWHILAMELLGPSLETKFNECGKRFSLKTTLQLAFQLLDVIFWVHSKNVIIRDIKPENFLLGLPNSAKKNQVHLIDLGLAKEYRVNGQHIPFVDGKSMCGTIRYMSINSQDGHEQSRRDDLESIAYILLIFLRGSLPWQGLRAPTREAKFERIKAAKRTTTVETLCNGHPEQIKQFLTIIRNLGFEEDPPYIRLKKLLKDLFAERNFPNDHLFDWNANTGNKAPENASSGNESRTSSMIQTGKRSQ